MSTNRPESDRRPANRRVVVLALILAITGCHGEDGDQGPPGDPGPPPNTRTTLDRNEDLPGAVLAITALGGGTGTNGSFNAGDRIAVTFTVHKHDGTALPLEEVDSAGIMVSGPTTNYQRVIERQADVLTMSVKNADGSYTYTFAQPIPDLYLAPYNDSPSFGASDGELTGQPLATGTYTVGMELYKNYTVGADSIRDVGNAIGDFRFGGATTLLAREVVKPENCSQCHTEVRAHGTQRRDARLCLLCHTAGSEDRNVASVEGGTPGASIEFSVMIHKIHNAAHLPSVLGVATLNDGNRTYAAPPKPYKLIGFNNSVNDFSAIAWPVWPSLNNPMPRDVGYTALLSTDRSSEDQIRRGVVSCAKCHGDPDASGPVAAPAQGSNHETVQSRRVCGSCHDDIDWSKPYVSNLRTMPLQANDDTCTLCHAASGDPLAVRDAHRHPQTDPSLFGGINFDVTNLTESGAHNGNGRIDPGEKIAITFTVTNDAGAPITNSIVSSFEAVISGPIDNRNVLLFASIPVNVLAGAQPITGNLPDIVLFEFLGDAANNGAIETFTTARTPHWAPLGAATTVYERTATGGASTLTAAAAVGQNFVEVASTAGLAANDFVVLDDGISGQEEYRQIVNVDGSRVYFRTTANYAYKSGLTIGHPAGATLQEVTLTARTAGTHYTLNAATGAIIEVAATSFTAGNAIVVSYTTDFVMPSTYPIPLNTSTDIGEDHGKWAGKPIVDGTYTLGIWGSTAINVVTAGPPGETTGYRGNSPPVQKHFLVGAATTLEAYPFLTDAEARCAQCHDQLRFHGNNRMGFDSCILCHGTSGSEDGPRYIYGAGAPDTPTLSIHFREMLHKIHMGRDLANASTYVISGRNGSANTYADVGFPAVPGGVSQCVKCHGTSNTAWTQPVARNHPTAQGAPVKTWQNVCGGCHDSDEAQAHIAQNTTGAGAESCAVCHGNGRSENVELVHKAR